MGKAVGGCLNQKRIVIRGNNGARKSIAAVQTNAKAAAAAVGNQLAGIGHKVVGRVFGGNTALNGMAEAGNFVLFGNADFRAVQGITFGNFNLGLHNIKAGNFFGNGMFNLNTRVNFNKVEVAVRGNEEFNRTGAEVINVFHQLNGCVADCLAQFGFKRKGRGNFHQFLVAALYGAVALEQMHNVALRIAQNLNFDMFRAFKVFFKVNFIAAESLHSFGFSHIVYGFQIFVAVYHAHAAPAAAVNGFKHNGKAVRLHKTVNVFNAVNRAVAARNHRNAGKLGLFARINFVAEHNKVFKARADKNNAFFGAAFCKVAVFA